VLATGGTLLPFSVEENWKSDNALLYSEALLQIPIVRVYIVYKLREK